MDADITIKKERKQVDIYAYYCKFVLRTLEEMVTYQSATMND